MKKILGLDLGTNSIGWALVEQDFEKKEGKILGMGSRIVPMSQDILGKFDAGQSISQTAERTQSRSVRKLYQRNQLRRERLHRVLNILGFLPHHYAGDIDFEKSLGQFKEGKEPKLNYRPVWNEKKQKNEFIFIFQDSFNEMIRELKQTQPQLFRTKANGNETKVPYDWTIYYLRKKALNQPITKQELAWIILNFNQKRGYYQLRGEEETDNTKLEEFHTLIVSDVQETEEKNAKGAWYNVILENGWIYRRQSQESLTNWKGKVKEFIVTTQLEKDGSLKLDKEGEVKRSFRAVDSEKDWIAIKKKTEQNVEQSRKYIGEYIFDAILQKPYQKIRGKLIKTIERKYYKEELEAILKEQAKHHPEFNDKGLYESCINELYPRNESHQNNIKDRDLKYLFVEDIIFYQRPLKSKKSTISGCQYESKFYLENDEKKEVELKAVPKSHPLYQEFRLWQFIQNLRIYQKEGIVDGKAKIDIPVSHTLLSSEEDWVLLFNFLKSKKEVEQKDIIGFLIKEGKINKHEKDNFRWNYVEDKKYPAGETHTQFLSRLSKVEGIDNPSTWLTSEKEFNLWHIVYSITDKKEYEKALGTYASKQGVEKDSFVEAFKKLPPFKSEYGAYSEKALKKILPLMRMGQYWSEAQINPETKDRIEKLLTAEFDERIRDRVREKAINLQSLEDFKGLPVWLVGYIVYDRHSEAKESSKWETPLDIDKYLNIFKQHSLRNPIVEQVVTETLRVVRDIWKLYGQGQKDFFDEIHIELGREMKNPAEKRKQITQRISENENTNHRIKQILTELMNEGVEARPYSPSHQEILKIYEEGVYQSTEKVEDDIDKIRKKGSPSKTDIVRYKLWLEQGYISPYTGQIIPLNKLFSKDYQIEHIIPQSRYFDDSLSNKVICESAVNEAKDNQTAYEFIKNSEESIIELGENRKVKVYSLSDYETHCNRYFKKNRVKLNHLLSEDIPEGFIERQLNDSRYISKLIKGLLSNIVKEESEQDAISKHIVPVTGSITNILKNDWGLNDKWNEIVAPRFQRLNKLTNSQDFGYWDQKINAFRSQVPDSIAKGFNKKRIDHRHHALDALVIACTTKDHINYITSINTHRENYSLISKLRRQEKIIVKGRERTVAKEYHHPWQGFTVQAKETLEKTVISFKQNLRVINKTNNRTWQWVKENGLLKKKRVLQTKGENWAIRKSLHKDTVSGKTMLRRKKKSLVPVSNTLTNPNLIVCKAIKSQIKAALQLYQGDLKKVKKHFKEHPVILNDGSIANKIEVYEFVEASASRGALSENLTRKQLESITDMGIQKILENHLKKYQDEKGNEHFDLAFNEEGIETLNRNIISLNEGKPHQPIYKVRFSEVGNKFPVGTKGNRKDKYVEAAKGTNLFFAIYWNDKKQERSFETIPLHEVIEHQKQVAHLPKEERTPTPINHEKGTFLFTLSPNDLVYVPTEEEQENPHLVDFDNLDRRQVNRIYKMVSCTGSECHFIPNQTASEIRKNENGTNSKNERIQNFFDETCLYGEGGKPIMIKNYCWKLKTDRLGNVKNVNHVQIRIQ
ncbi:HNH endonuclease domain-containing protein [Fulvivirgaceae bacterium BMA10]|uniref:CRISPR-associated endonuclease Cas9 n=1 Tax=Splendidivirga corallicola TaxID=3051826 RepID=A0ABT8KVZ1_9BACT|nr:HNH endonuclease domain-containing protein [Fulvivirgaceae bacterium BMA10]